MQKPIISFLFICAVAPCSATMVDVAQQSHMPPSHD
jgi:hypothetical protein